MKSTPDVHKVTANAQMRETPKNLFERLTPIANKLFSGDFKSSVAMLKRPYFRLSQEDYEKVKDLSAGSDVLLMDGKTQVTFGSADNGLALMPLSKPI